MSIFEAIILGVIQGLTEFLPVSSSGHLELAKAVFGDGAVGKESMLMTVVLHFATALSTVVIFRKDIVQIFKGLFKFKNNDELKFSIRIIVSMIPAALVGVLLKDEIESLFGGAIMLVGFMLIVTGLLLFLADKAKKTDKEVGLMQSLLIGISQAIAILPGISRSGATISTSVLLGIDREKAARFSFLMVVPLIFGAMAVDTKDYLDAKDLEAMPANERSQYMTQKLIEDEVVTAEQGMILEMNIWEMEYAWDYAKKTTSDDPKIIAKYETRIENDYLASLEKQGLSDEKIEEITSHEYGMIRPITKPGMMILGIGFLCAFVTGLFACKWMISLVKRAQLKYFSFYCFLVGLTAIVVAMV